MRKYKFTGEFRAPNGDSYYLTAYCVGFVDAYFRLMAQAIKQGRHPDLYGVTREDGQVVSGEELATDAKNYTDAIRHLRPQS